MMFSTVASVVSSCPGMVGSCTGFCDQSTVAGGAPGKKSSDTYTAPVNRFPVFKLRTDPVGHQAVDHLPAHGFEIFAGLQVRDLDSESLRVHMDRHRHREFEGLQVDLRANLRDLSDQECRETRPARRARARGPSP